MSEHIQPLLERIQSEGLKKAETERDAILERARAEAEGILESARKEAADLTAQAESEAEATLQRGKAALRQAARDELLRLRTEIGRQLNLAAKKAASAPLSSEDLIPDLLRELVKAHGASGTVTVEAGAPLADKLKDLLPALLKDAGAEGGEVVMNPKTGAGFHLRFGDSAQGIDLTDEAVADWLGAHLRPELAELLKPESSGD